MPKYLRGGSVGVLRVKCSNLKKCSRIVISGRLQYTAFQTAIDEFNGALKDKYTFLQPGFGSLKSLANKKKYKVRVTAKFYVDLKNVLTFLSFLCKTVCHINFVSFFISGNEVLRIRRF